MQKLADICIRRPVFAAMIILALVVVGAASYSRLGVDRFPSVDLQPPVVSKFNNDSSPVMSIALSGNRSLRELTEYADKVIKIQLERSPGVGEEGLVGGLQRASTGW